MNESTDKVKVTYISILLHFHNLQIKDMIESFFDSQLFRADAEFCF